MVRTGQFELEGFKHTGGLVDIQVATFLENNVPHCKVELCGLAIAFQGTVLSEPTYDQLMSALEMVQGGGSVSSDKAAR